MEVSSLFSSGVLVPFEFCKLYNLLFIVFLFFFFQPNCANFLWDLYLFLLLSQLMLQFYILCLLICFLLGFFPELQKIMKVLLVHAGYSDSLYTKAYLILFGKVAKFGCQGGVRGINLLSFSL